MACIGLGRAVTNVGRTCGRTILLVYVKVIKYADKPRFLIRNAEEKDVDVPTGLLDVTIGKVGLQMEIGPDKTKVVTNNQNSFQRELKIKEARGFSIRLLSSAIYSSM